MVEAEAFETESVIVVMDANRNKGCNVDALDWALKNVVRPGDTVIVLGVLCHFEKKNSCFPLIMSGGISGIWERLDLSSHGQGEVRPRVLGEEIERKREQYQNNLKPFYRQCKKNEVKLEVKLVLGFCPQKVTVEQARRSNPRWIVLDSHLKKYKLAIYSHSGCKMAVMKRKDVATLMPARAVLAETTFPIHQPSEPESIPCLEAGESSNSKQPPLPQSPSWYPLSWRNGFPRAFSQDEVELMTNGFSEINLVQFEDNIKVYEGVLQKSPVIVKSFSENDQRFWTVLEILSRVRHRNIMNLLGYCCSSTSLYLLYDYPCMGTLEWHLQNDDLARNLSWKARWYVALEIGGSLRYLHEECVDGAIVHFSVSSTNVVFCHGCTTMLGNFLTARWLKDDVTNNEDSHDAMFSKLVDDERLSVDVYDYGVFLIELITGKSAKLFQNENRGQDFVEWALQLLENGPIREVLDPRLDDMSDSRVVHNMANAALLCLKNDSSDQKFSMSEVLAVVRGDQFAMAKC